MVYQWLCIPKLHRETSYAAELVDVERLQVKTASNSSSVSPRTCPFTFFFFVSAFCLAIICSRVISFESTVAVVILPLFWPIHTLVELVHCKTCCNFITRCNVFLFSSLVVESCLSVAAWAVKLFNQTVFRGRFVKNKLIANLSNRIKQYFLYLGGLPRSL